MDSRGNPALSHSPGKIPKMDPPERSIIYTIGVLESRIGGFVFFDPLRALGY